MLRTSLVNAAVVKAKVEEGAWRMPWLTEATKDVISCDKPGVGADDH